MSAKPTNHGARCIEERFLDIDQLALILANGYDLTEPVEFDYDLAQKVIEYVRTCSKAGQIRYHLAAGMSTAGIAVQLDMTEGYVKRIMSQDRNAA